MKKIETVLVVFSATSIHREIAKVALDLAEENDAKLIILSVRDKNVVERVAKVTKDHGFLGKDLVEKLAEDIKRDRDELIAHRLGMVEEEAQKRGIEFETLQVKGDLVENAVDIVKAYNVDRILIEDMGKTPDILKDILV